MVRSNRLVAAVLAAILVVAAALVIGLNMMSGSEKKASGTSSVPRPVPGAGSSTTSAPTSSSTSSQSQVPTRATATTGPGELTPGVWKEGTPGYSVEQYIRAANSLSFRDPGPTAWVARAKAWTTPAFAAQYLDPLATPAAGDAAEWSDAKSQQVEYGVNNLQVSYSSTQSSTGMTRGMTASYSMRRTVQGNQTVADTPTTYNLVVKQVGGKWLVDAQTIAVTD